MYSIETMNLTKRFGSFKAVDELNLKVPEGSIYGFLGPNGAGKTTTIKMLTGLTKPTSGEIKINGRRVMFGSLRSRHDIGFLPDVPSFYDWMTPVEFLKFSGELFNIDSKILKNRIEYLLHLVGLSGVKKKIGGFSRGMKQRLGIAQALINEPEVVFLDEPTSALDPIGRKEVMDIIVKLSGKMTVFFSTHILADVERVCDRVVILNEGRVQIEDTISSLRQKYSHHGIVIEVGSSEQKERIKETLKMQEWVVDIPESRNGEFTVNVKDMNKAQKSIPGILYDKGVELRRFSLLEPTLEDIFMKVVSK